MQCSSRRIEPLQYVMRVGSTPTLIGGIKEMEMISRETQLLVFHFIRGLPRRQHET
jgi:hypothetical protein